MKILISLCALVMLVTAPHSSWAKPCPQSRTNPKEILDIKALAAETKKAELDGETFAEKLLKDAPERHTL